MISKRALSLKSHLVLSKCFLLNARWWWWRCWWLLVTAWTSSCAFVLFIPMCAAVSRYSLQNLICISDILYDKKKTESFFCREKKNSKIICRRCDLSLLLLLEMTQRNERSIHTHKMTSNENRLEIFSRKINNRNETELKFKLICAIPFVSLVFFSVSEFQFLMVVCCVAYLTCSETTKLSRDATDVSSLNECTKIFCNEILHIWSSVIIMFCFYWFIRICVYGVYAEPYSAYTIHRTLHTHTLTHSYNQFQLVGMVFFLFFSKL